MKRAIKCFLPDVSVLKRAPGTPKRIVIGKMTTVGSIQFCLKKIVFAPRLFNDNRIF